MRNVTFAVLPDTQVYSAYHPRLFLAQTKWLAEHGAERGIACVLHVGDVTDHNAPVEWDVARRAFDSIEGRVPYLIAPGNHDYSPNGTCTSRENGLDERFAPAPDVLTCEPGRMAAGSARVVETPLGPWLAIAVEFGPRDAVLEWAGTVLKEHAAMPAILVTHAYLYSDGTRYDRARRPDQKWSPYVYGVSSTAGGVNDGEQIWQKLVSRHDSIRLVLCGHVLNEGVARQTSTRETGTIVHELLANYQTREEGGQGFMRLIEIREDGVIDVRTYSPVLDRDKTDPSNRFTLAGDPQYSSP